VIHNAGYPNFRTIFTLDPSPGILKRISIWISGVHVKNKDLNVGLNVFPGAKI